MYRLFCVSTYLTSVIAWTVPDKRDSAGSSSGAGLYSHAPETEFSVGVNPAVD